MRMISRRKDALLALIFPVKKHPFLREANVMKSSVNSIILARKRYINPSLFRVCGSAKKSEKKIFL
jgi:hypothetical protein